MRAGDLVVKRLLHAFRQLPVMLAEPYFFRLVASSRSKRMANLC